MLVYAGIRKGMHRDETPLEHAHAKATSDACTLGEGSSVRPSGRDQWKFLSRGVSLKTALLAFVPVVALIAFLFLFAAVYRAVVHVQGPIGVVLDIIRSLVEIVTVVIALRYFFQILQRGVAREISIDSKERS